MFKGLVAVFAVAVLVFAGCSTEVPTGVEQGSVDQQMQVAAKPAKKADCATIQSGAITSSTGQVLETGYDVWGYNYQALMFNGIYGNYTRPNPPLTEGDAKLQMKWNQAWMSNTDCDGDGVLDRHFGFPTYRGSGAWLTNHEQGEGYTYFVKIVAAPLDAVAVGGTWYTADGEEIGPVIWGAFAIVQEVYNVQGSDTHGVGYKSPASPGFGTYKPE